MNAKSILNKLSTWRMEWNEQLSVNVPEIDAEHRHFIGLVNELNEAIITRMSLEVIQNRMQLVIDDAVKHFSHEELLFIQWGYPEAEIHAKRHAQILIAMNQIMEVFQRGGLEYEWIEAGLNVKKALIEHLLTEDMKYRDYYKNKNVQFIDL